MSSITIDFTGFDKLAAMIRQYPGLIIEALEAAGKEASAEIRGTLGIQTYPPAPPNSTYIRGGPKSEKYGSQFYTEQRGYITAIGNRASYAVYVGGDWQPDFMAAIGWRKLADVAEEKKEEISDIFKGWMNRAAEKAGL